jgi:hypothetical protein
MIPGRPIALTSPSSKPSDARVPVVDVNALLQGIDLDANFRTLWCSTFRLGKSFSYRLIQRWKDFGTECDMGADSVSEAKQAKNSAQAGFRQN